MSGHPSPVLQWGVRHIDDDGTDLGIVQFSEAEARAQIGRCAAGGSSCELVCREISPWAVVGEGVPPGDAA